MTPKEKAEELVVKYQLMAEIKYIEEPYVTTTSIKSKNAKIEFASKKCALIAVDEILKSEPRYPSNVDWDDAGATHQYYYEAQREEAARYWEQVKQEIEKL